MPVVTVLSEIDALLAIEKQLEELSSDLCDSNVFYEPWMLYPALIHLGQGCRFQFLCLYDADDADRLCGFLPLVGTALHPWLPLPGFRLWDHAQCFRCTPLLRRGYADRCWEAVFDWLQALPGRQRFLQLPKLPATSEACAALQRVQQQRPKLRRFALKHESALLLSDETSDKVLDRAMSGKTLSTLRRKRRQLEKSGGIVAHELDADSDLPALIEEFLDLEASGWKGQAGTALKLRPKEAAFFRVVMQEAHRRGRLSLLYLRHRGRMIAARSQLLAPPGSFVFKIAFDEAFSKYSPGMLLELEEIQRLHDTDDPLRGAIAWSDSCSAPNNGPFYRSWPDRQAILHYRVATGWGACGLAISLWPQVRRVAWWLGLLDGAKRDELFSAPSP